MTEERNQSPLPAMPPPVRQWFQDTVSALQPLAGLDRWVQAGCTMPPVFGVVVDVNPYNAEPVAPAILLTLGYQLARMIPALALHVDQPEEHEANCVLAHAMVGTTAMLLLVANTAGWYVRDPWVGASEHAQAPVISDGQRVLWQGRSPDERLLTVGVRVPFPSHPAVRDAQTYGIQRAPVTPQQQAMLCEILCDLIVQLLRAQMRRPSELQAWLDAVCAVGPKAPLSWVKGLQA